MLKRDAKSTSFSTLAKQYLSSTNAVEEKGSLEKRGACEGNRAGWKAQQIQLSARIGQGNMVNKFTRGHRLGPLIFFENRPAIPRTLTVVKLSMDFEGGGLSH